ncbi:hypothetical protein GCM10010246_40800 [Streptomyces cuspidosporus]|uniref:Uncharacterized protein n=1 Tax=Streptomyces cuspidosporus TaxID=66882 RepID=A0ABN3GD97_9ACTN
MRKARRYACRTEQPQGSRARPGRRLAAGAGRVGGGLGGDPDDIRHYTGRLLDHA